LREKRCKELEYWEIVLVNVASKCEFTIGLNGASGFLYKSVKDRLKWSGLRSKYFAWLIMRIGEWLVLSDEEYQKRKVRTMRMSTDEMIKTLKAAFGDGNG